MGVVNRRYAAVVCSFFASVGSGTMYVYSAYAPQLADRLSFSATQASFIGTMGGVGLSLFAALAGVFIDTYGPTLPIFTGSVLVLAGYFTMWRCYVDQTSAVVLVACAYMVAGFGSALVLNSSIKASTLNFPHNRGTASAFPLSGFGLSATLFSSVAGLLFPGNTSGFLATLTLVASGLCFINWPFIRVYPVPGEARDTAVEAGQSAVAAEVAGDTPTEPLLETSPAHSAGSSSPRHVPTYGTAEAGTVTEEELVAAARIHRKRTRVGWRVLSRATFWQHFLLLGLCAGIGQMYIYSVGYCVRALTHDAEYTPGAMQSLQAMQVALISIFNFAGRVVSGTVSDLLIRQYQMQRLWLVAFALTIALAAHITVAHLEDETKLWAVSVSIGFAYGLVYGCYPSIISESFGLSHFMQNWGWAATSPVFSAYAFNLMFGRIYDAHTSHEPGAPRVCTLGSACYASAFHVTAGVAFFCLCLCLFMISRRHKHYPEH